MVVHDKKKTLAAIVTIALLAGGLEARELTLQDCLRLAVQNDKRLKQSEIDVKISEQGVVSSRSVYWPNIRLSSGYNQSFEERFVWNSDTDSYRFINVKNDSYSLGMNASQTLFRGGRNLSSHLQSRQSLEKTRYNLKRQRQTVLFNAEEAYLRVLEAEQQLEVRRDGFELAKGNRRLTELRFKSGLEAKSTLDYNYAEEKQAKLYLVQAELDLGLARDSLRIVIGGEDKEQLVLAGAGEYLELWLEEGWCLKTAFDNRPDWLSAQAEKRQRRYSFLSNLGSWLPTISANGGYRYWTDELPFDKPTWSVGVSASYQFFSGFSRAAGTRTAELRYRRAELDLEKMRDDIQKDVRSSLVNLKNQQERVRLDKEFIAVRGKQLSITRLRYKSGRSSSRSLLRAQERLTDQEIRYWRAVFNVRRAQARLARALGLASDELKRLHGESAQ